MTADATAVADHTEKDIITLILTPPSLRRIPAIVLDNNPGRLSVHMAKVRKVRARPQMTHPDWPRLFI